MLSQHSSCTVKKDMVVLARCIQLPLSAGFMSQRIVILFGKRDDLQVSRGIYSV